MKKLLLILSLIFPLSLFAQWDHIHTHNEQIYTVDAVTADIVYVGGYHSAIRSLDGGQNWEDINYDLQEFLIHDIEFLSPDSGYILGIGGIIKTVNSGIDWILVAPDSIRYLKASFISPDSGWVIGENWSSESVVLRTYDGGVTWDYAMLSTELGEPTDIQMINSSVGYITTHFEIFKTIDGGDTWFDIMDSSILGYPSCCSFLNADTGFIGAHGLYRTNDGGNSWIFITDQYAIGYFWDSSLQFINIDTGYYVGDDGVAGNGMLCTTENSGNDWMRNKGRYVDIDMYDEEVGYCIEWIGEIYKTTNGGLYVGLEEQKAGINTDAFPNPFSSETTINVSFDFSSKAKLQIFTIDGKLVKHIELSSILDNTQTVSWDGCDATGKEVPPGVYLVRISDGKFNQAQKIVKR